MPRRRRGPRCDPSSALAVDVAAAVAAATSRTRAQKVRKAKKVLAANGHKWHRRAKTPVNKRTLVAARLLAGVRCHNRFYGALVSSFETAYCMNHRHGSDGLAATIIAEACGAVPVCSLNTTIMFEVNLGGRRPDCICVLDRAGVAGAPRESVCLIVELKTCRFSRSALTESKKNQYATGLRQLRDSAKIICDVAVPGADFVHIVPVLVFVAQRSMRIMDVRKFNERVVRANAELLRLRLAALGVYSRSFAAAPQRLQSAQDRCHDHAATPKPTPAVVPSPPAPPNPAPPQSRVGFGSALAMATAVMLGEYARENKPPR
ncbi:unknown [Psittacid alphaherpesvirus 1]|uniref:Protein UL24 n=1 Tax=Psittacid herpesvirus 1 (isolate Amazon parrot/-/97-0001/1997) TaxID=670426 RepID=UL24_PSHV1|nr:nuclear protein UL24 [Psittacid alphaherpesvirus 1]Q6UDK8.1 RecName: Full=Protein UL24 [Psittacid herpesvirus 1 Amazon parrot/1997]AAQ73702.1 unknown [Psittacid alphaherpesvirus 1]